jgi:type 1 glutamine amidotransferase
MKTRVLVICGDAWHPAATVRQGLAPLGEHGFDFEFLDDSTKWRPEMMQNFSVVLLAKANMVSATDHRAWLTLDFEPAFQKYLQRGGGLLFIHGGTSRYDGLPVLRRMTRGTFVSHPPECAVTFEPLASHALAKGVNTFTARDEHYVMKFEGSKADIFLQSRSEHGVQPAGWSRIVDGGRVGVLTPGHNLEVWPHPEFQKILSNMLRWTAKLD